MNEELIKQAAAYRKEHEAATWWRDRAAYWRERAERAEQALKSMKRYTRADVLLLDNLGDDE